MPFKDPIKKKKYHEAYSKEWYKKNRERVSRAGKRYRTKNQVKVRMNDVERSKDYQFRRKYNISLAEVLFMFSEQNGRCALCKEEIKKKDSIVPDHNHRTGDVRGIIHQKCNTLLGLAGDSIKKLELAIRYLKSKGSEKL